MEWWTTRYHVPSVRYSSEAPGMLAYVLYLLALHALGGYGLDALRCWDHRSIWNGSRAYLPAFLGLCVTLSAITRRPFALFPRDEKLGTVLRRHFAAGNAAGAISFTWLQDLPGLRFTLSDEDEGLLTLQAKALLLALLLLVLAAAAHGARVVADAGGLPLLTSYIGGLLLFPLASASVMLSSPVPLRHHVHHYMLAAFVAAVASPPTPALNLVCGVATGVFAQGVYAAGISDMMYV